MHLLTTKFLLTILSMGLIFSCRSPAGKKEVFSSGSEKFVIDTLARGLQTPFGLDFLPGGKIIFTERSVKNESIRLLDTSTLAVSNIGNAPAVFSESDGGMLDILVHPDYASNGWIYYAYAQIRPDSTSTLLVERAKIVNNSLTGRQPIFEVFPYYKSSNHFGCRLLIKDGYLFIGMGDRYAAKDSAQSLSNDFGKIIRLHDDGKIPADNPFVNNRNARPEIWSYGHRNPQGLAFHPTTGELWEHEHGPQGGDEINIIKPGRNYGWPVITYGEEYGGGKIGAGLVAKDGMEQPHYFYRPSIAPSGMTFYTGDKFPAWKNSLFLGSLAYRHLNHLYLKGDTITREERLLTKQEWRMRNVKQGRDGLLYVTTDKGMILRLRPFGR